MSAVLAVVRQYGSPDQPRDPAGTATGGQWAAQPKVRTVGEDFPEELLHGTKRSNLAALLDPRDESSKRATGNIMLDALAPPVQNEFKAELLLSEKTRPQQANMWSQGRGNTLAVITLQRGAKVLDLADEATRTPVLTMGSEPQVLRFFERPRITDDMIVWHQSRVSQGYKDRYSDWRDRVARGMDPNSKDFSVDTWRESLVPYAKARGYAAVRFADETLVTDRSVMVAVRPATAQERAAASISPSDLRGGLFAKEPLSKLKQFNQSDYAAPAAFRPRNADIIFILAHADAHGRVYAHEDDRPHCFAHEGYYAEVKRTLDAQEERALKRLREVLVQARDALISRVLRRLPDPRGFRLKGMRDFRIAVRDLLERASVRGGLDAKREVREGRRAVREYGSPDQPRDPAGTPTGGQWVSTGGGGNKWSGVSDVERDLMTAASKKVDGRVAGIAWRWTNKEANWRTLSGEEHARHQFDIIKEKNDYAVFYGRGFGEDKSRAKFLSDYQSLRSAMLYAKDYSDYMNDRGPRPESFNDKYFAFNPDQPRDDQGQWTDGGGKLNPSIMQPGQRRTSLGFIGDDRAQEILDLAAKNAAEWRYGFEKEEQKNVPFSKVRAMQPYVYAGTVDEYKNPKMTTDMRSPLAFHSEGMHYIINGTHRAEAIKARGETSLMLRVINIDSMNEKTYASPAVFRPRNAQKWLREKEFYVTDLLDSAITESVRGVLVNGLKTGELNAVVADKIWTAFEPYLGDPSILKDGEPLSPARLETIVRTNLTDAYNHGRMMEYTSDDMLPFLNAIRYSAILDERTTPVCAFLDGKLFDPIDPDLTDLLPPNHFNALAAGALISTRRGEVPIENVRVGDYVLTHRGRWQKVYATMRKQERCEIQRLQISSGRALWATEEHPLLTDRGWKCVRDLKVGDKLFEFLDHEPGFGDVATSDPQHFPSLFDEPQIAYELTGYCRPAAVNTIVKFDEQTVFGKSEVRDVITNRELNNKINGAARQEQRPESIFSRAWVCAQKLGVAFVGFFKHPLHVHGVVLSHAEAGIRPFDSVSPVVFAGAFGDNFRRAIGDACLFFFGTDFDPVPFAPKGQRCSNESKLFFNGPERLFAAPMILEDQLPHDFFVHGDTPLWTVRTIIMQKGRKYEGFVYNLAVENDESYHAEGIVVHNCRSIVVPVVVGEVIDQEDFITPEEVGHAKELADAKFLEQHNYVIASKEKHGM